MTVLLRIQRPYSPIFRVAIPESTQVRSEQMQGLSAPWATLFVLAQAGTLASGAVARPPVNSNSGPKCRVLPGDTEVAV